MTSRHENHTASPCDPRYVRIAGRWVNVYKVFLCIGVYAAILLSTAIAAAGGISPFGLGGGLLLCTLVGMIGARLYHLAVNVHEYRAAGLRSAVWDTQRGGWSVFGGLVIFPFSTALEPMIAIPMPVFWDYMALGIAVGGPIVRFGCIRNGCCLGRLTNGWFGVPQHDMHGLCRRRVPVQWLEIGWWLLAGLALIWLWRDHLPPGSYALGVLAWYGIGRFWLEPLRETPALVRGRVRVDRVVGALLAVVACGGLLRLTLGVR